MKTSIITFQESSNSGALLQAYALQTTLSRLSEQPCDILNYHSQFKKAQYSVSGKKNLLVLINSLLSAPIKKKIEKKANSFKRQYLNMTKKIFNSSNEMIVLNDQYDKFYCGSDQVWNAINTGADVAYFLDFVEDKAKIASYAPSIALTEIPEKLKDFYTTNINMFQHLSVREKSGQVLIEELTGKKAQVVVDPTLLLDKKEWQQIAKPESRKKPYIFVYYISYVPHMINFVKKLKIETGFDVIVAIKTIRDYKNGFTGKIVSTEEFVRFISNAEYVVTNSFHGTAFSVNFEKEFFAFGNKKVLAKANSRVTDLLEIINLSNRFIGKEYSIQSLLSENNKIDYSTVSKKLLAEREKSIDYIKTTLD